jgi:hypothetical protein
MQMSGKNCKPLLIAELRYGMPLEQMQRHLPLALSGNGLCECDEVIDHATAIFADDGTVLVVLEHESPVFRTDRNRDKEIMALQRLRDRIMVLDSSAGVAVQRATTTDRTRKPKILCSLGTSLSKWGSHIRKELEFALKKDLPLSVQETFKPRIRFEHLVAFAAVHFGMPARLIEKYEPELVAALKSAADPAGTDASAVNAAAKSSTAAAANGSTARTLLHNFRYTCCTRHGWDLSL